MIKNVKMPIKEFPKPISILKLIGPSFIILALGLGSGEVILWPYLVSKYGLGIIWGAILGITFQYIMNMEIERYALARGESIFVGFYRKSKLIPFWFILSSFVPWIWPGIIASSATIFANLLGFKNSSFVAMLLLVVIGLILSLGPVLYKTIETMQRTIISIGVPTIFVITVVLAKNVHWESLANGLVGVGDGYNFLPAGISLSAFLAALAYSGAGGNLNLSQSFYVREKGYGMGVYAEKIKGLLYGTSKKLTLTGTDFEINKNNLANFKAWWRNINIEHLIVFWFTGAFTICMLGLLSYITAYKNPQATEGIGFLFLEAEAMSQMLFPYAGTFFLLIAGTTLFGTQLGIFDSTSRIISENIVLASNGKLKDKYLAKSYFVVLWSQIIAGIFILLSGFNQPLQLVILAAVLNAFAMFVHVGLTLWVNKTLLHKSIRPGFLRTLGMVLAFLMYGGFSIYVLLDRFGLLYNIVRLFRL